MKKPSRNYYDETIDRIDPGAYYASASISLRLIAKTLRGLYWLAMLNTWIIGGILVAHELHR